MTVLESSEKWLPHSRLYGFLLLQTDAAGASAAATKEKAALQVGQLT